MRKLQALVDGILAKLHSNLEVLYAKTGHLSILPERLLGLNLIHTLYSIRSERQLVQHIDNTCSIAGLSASMDEKVWDLSSFTKNRDSLLNETVVRSFFGKVLG